MKMSRRISKTVSATAAVLVVGSIATLVLAALAGRAVWQAGVDGGGRTRHP